MDNIGKEFLFNDDVPAHVRKDTLLAMCDNTKANEVYQRGLTSEELVKLEKEFIQNNVKFSKLNDDFKKVKDDFKNKMKPIEQLMAEEIKILKTKSVETEGTVFLLADQESKLMHIYDETGHLISSRPLLPEERQLSITRAASNN